MPMQILIVEDNEDIRTALVISLQDEGFLVTAAEEGNGALAALEKMTPDVVLLDMQLPGMSGIEILKKMRQTLDIPILMFTSSGDRSLVKDAVAAGATDYVLKGTGMDVLIGRIRTHLATVENAGDSHEPQTVSQDSQQIVYVGQNITVTRLLTDVARRHDIELAGVSTGKIALTQLSARRPTVIVMDLKLPDTNGLNLLKAINENENASGIPAVMIADGGPPEIRRSAVRHGAVGVFSTPINELDFEHMIRDLVFAGRRTGAA